MMLCSTCLGNEGDPGESPFGSGLQTSKRLSCAAVGDQFSSLGSGSIRSYVDSRIFPYTVKNRLVGGRKQLDPPTVRTNVTASKAAVYALAVDKRGRT